MNLKDVLDDLVTVARNYDNGEDMAPEDAVAAIRLLLNTIERAEAWVEDERTLEGLTALLLSTLLDEGDMPVTLTPPPYGGAKGFKSINWAATRCEPAPPRRGPQELRRRMAARKRQRPRRPHDHGDQPMTVAELIKILEARDPDTLIVYLADNDRETFETPITVEDHAIHPFVHGGPSAWRIAFQEEIEAGKAKRGLLLV